MGYLTYVCTDAFQLTQPNWTFSTPKLLHAASIDMKMSFYTTLFYVAVTTPSITEYLNIPQLTTAEAQAWSAIVLSIGLVYGTFSKRQAAKKVKELNEKSSEKKSD